MELITILLISGVGLMALFLILYGIKFRNIRTNKVVGQDKKYILRISQKYIRLIFIMLGFSIFILTPLAYNKKNTDKANTDQINKEVVEISKNKIYEASSEWQAPGYESDKAFDDEINTRWSSSITEENSWISVDFGGDFTISAISMNECKEWSNVASYKVQVLSENGWSDAYTGGKVINDERVSFNEVSTSKMRFVFDNIMGKAVTFFNISVFGYGLTTKNSDSTELLNYEWLKFPYNGDGKVIVGNYLYITGGYNSVDMGCPAWGSNKDSELIFIGDKAGDIIIKYQNGEIDEIPLVFGYTMWFKYLWSPNSAPFKGIEANGKMADELKSVLQLQSAYNGSISPILKAKIRNLQIESIVVKDNTLKPGKPIFDGAYIVENAEGGLIRGDKLIRLDQNFFADHTYDVSKGMDDSIVNKLNNINNYLVTGSQAYNNVPEFKYPDTYKGSIIRFTGTSTANIATGVLYYNIEDMLTKIEDNGMMNESSKGAPTWHYDGFGTWVPGAGSYYKSMFSRNNKDLVSLSYLGYSDKALKITDYLNRQLMYFPNNKLSILGKPIPGHWTVMPHDPLVYSKNLVNVGWATKYTKALFGKDYQNMGNMEPDGHGLVMMGIWNVWKNTGSSTKWVDDNWIYINEAVAFIQWCLDNPDVSFSEYGLMYGETEGGMQDFTMYNNVPIYLGVRMYSDMAKTAGKSKEAAEWTRLADELEKAILKKFVNTKTSKWDLSKVGFYHDPSISGFADYIGYDVQNDMPTEWYNLARNTYADDVKAYIKDTFVGPRGIGYDHNIISQNSLLLDMTEDYDKFINNLTKICYAPALPKPYIVPEGISYSPEKDIFRRQGDLGNLAQQAETVKTLLMTTGISKAYDGVVKLLPRLPKDWKMDVIGLDIPSTWTGSGNSKIDFKCEYPKDKMQSAVVKITGTEGLSKIMFRSGPFPSEMKSPVVTVNGIRQSSQLFEAGDSKWCWVTIDGILPNKIYSISVSE